MTRLERLEWMYGVEVGEVWGVGRRIAKRLEAMHIGTVLDLRNASPKEIRAQFGVVMERTCNELRESRVWNSTTLRPPSSRSCPRAVLVLRWKPSLNCVRRWQATLLAPPRN